MGTITKPPLLDETGQSIVEAINDRALSMTDRTGTRIAIALERLSSTCLTQGDIVDNLDSRDATAPLSANQGRELKALLGNMYPVGAIYTSNNNTNPEQYFGGQWINVNNNAEHVYLLAKYQTGYSWYRLYSDGWVEQGGKTDVMASNTLTTIVLPYAMENNKYIVTACERYDTGTSDNNNENYWIYDISNTNFNIYNSAGGYKQLYWRANGYVTPPTQTKFIWQRIA